MIGLRKFLDQLKQLPEEKPIEPELKAEKKEKDRKIRCAVCCRGLVFQMQIAKFG